MSSPEGAVAIIGALGLVGGAISSALSSEGFRIVGTSRNPRRLSIKGVELLQLAPDSGRSDVERVLSGVGTVVFAAGVGESLCIRNPELAFGVNAHWPGYIASIASKNEATRRFIYVSTAKVYGETLAGFIDENSPTRARQAYGRSHLEGEKRVHAAGDDGTLETLALRIANLVGAPSVENTGIEHLLPYMATSSAVRQGLIALRGSGEERRDFVSLGFLCRRVHELITGAQFPPGRTLNVGSGLTVSVEWLVRKIASYASQALGIAVEVHLGDENESTQEDLFFRTNTPDFSEKVRADDLESSLREMVDYYIMALASEIGTL